MIHQKVEREATLEERARIARDIHDSLEQALAGTSLQLNALADSMRGTSQEPQRILKVARSMVNHAQEEARRTVRNLRLLDLEKQDLPTALSQFAATSGNDSPVKIVVTTKGLYKTLPNQVENHLLRIGQEAVTNAVKHAGAGTIRVEFNSETGGSEPLDPQDDGCGFTTANDHRRVGRPFWTSWECGNGLKRSGAGCKLSAIPDWARLFQSGCPPPDTIQIHPARCTFSARPKNT